MADIFDEVAEDLRAERAQALLRRYGGLMLAVALLVIAAVAAGQVWQWYQARQNARAASAYFAAMAQADAIPAAGDPAQRAAAAKAFLAVARQRAGRLPHPRAAARCGARGGWRQSAPPRSRSGSRSPPTAVPTR